MRVQEKLNTNQEKQNTEHIQMKNSKILESYNCTICKDSGLELVNGRYRKCKCQIEADTLRELRKTGLSDLAMDKSFSNFEAWNDDIKEMKNVATNYFLEFDKIKNSDSNSLALLGESGTGKTHLLLALMKNFIIRKRLDVSYMSFVDGISLLKQNVLNGEVYQKKMNRYKNADLLVVDDLFKGAYSESDIRIMLEIINHRYINKLPVMISSELGIEEITKIDKALGGRIVERTRSFIYYMKNPKNNYRFKKI
ncbi:ATP-binding protein [Clostridium perfringens]|nr:ATP-binding protein [Clostridium perfringens]